jgi:hypothetical protein
MNDQSLAQTQTSTATTTGVFVLLTAKPGVTRDQVMAVMPAEIRATVQLYLDGKISEWYSREDGRGGVFLLNTKDVAEARAIMEALPLAKEHLLDDEYIPVGRSCRCAFSWRTQRSNSNAQERRHAIERA